MSFVQFFVLFVFVTLAALGAVLAWAFWLLVSNNGTTDSYSRSDYE